MPVTVGLLTVPILVDLWMNGWQRVFSYFAADTFYYTTVARNFAAVGFPSFDGLLPTTGFHPAWQVSLGALYVVIDVFHFSEAFALTTILILLVVLISIAIMLIWEFVRSDLGGVPKIFLLLPIGVVGPAVA